MKSLRRGCSMSVKTIGAGLFAIVAALPGAGPAHAADEEIQVYMNEMGDVGRLTLGVHVNDAIVGPKTKSYPHHRRAGTLMKWPVASAAGSCTGGPP